MKKFILMAALVFTSAAAAQDAPSYSQPPWQQSSEWPDRVVTTLTTDPARSIAVNWRTDGDVRSARAEIVRASADARFDLNSRVFTATTQSLALSAAALAPAQAPPPIGGEPVLFSYHAVTFDELEPNTRYAFRVGGAEGRWSEWYEVRTASLDGPVSFLYLGDAQHGVRSHWARVIRAAHARDPNAAFMLHAGDFVNVGASDYEWAQWFEAGSYIHATLPAVPVAGNHEYRPLEAERGRPNRTLSSLWRAQFNLPADLQLPEALHETVYTARYNDNLQVFVLDTTAVALFDVQARWLDAALAASTARWRVVAFHHPIFSSGMDRDNPSVRAAFLPIIERYGVDLVLQGHDHTYARGEIRRSAQRTRRCEAVGPVFVNSVAGAKQYEWSSSGWAPYAAFGVELSRQAENTQLYQLVRVDRDQLSFEAYAADGGMYDAFTITRARSGSVCLAQAAVGPTRRFHNTGAYLSKDGLND